MNPVTKALRRVPSVAAWSLEWAGGRWLLGPRIAETRGIGVHGGGLSAEEMTACLTRLNVVLDLVQEFAPRVVPRLLQSGTRLLFASIGTLSYWSMNDVIVISPQPLISSPDWGVASLLCHEATHARFTHAGIWHWPDLMYRIEARCVTEQQFFLASLPAQRFPDAARYSQQLTLGLRHPWWTPRERVRGIVEALQRDSNDRARDA